MPESPTQPFVFFSYARADSELVTCLRNDLQAQGIKTWIDQEELPPGVPDWEEALRTAIRAAHAVLFIASPNARVSRNVKDELRIAEMYQRPVYPIWVTGTDWMEAAPIGWGGAQHFDAREERYAMELPKIVMVLRQQLSEVSSSSEASSTSSKASDLNWVPRNPYKGLRAFTSKDSHDFFGRNRLIEELADTLEESLIREKESSQSARLLAIVGPSGSGKSSVVMAGLLPRLQAAELPGSQEWVYLDPIVPDKNPINSLASVLWSKLGNKSLTMIRQDLEDSSALGLHLLANSLVKQQGGKVVLVIDQFEELFTQTVPEDIRQHFINLLVTAISVLQGPTVVILTLRADFYDRPMQYSDLGKLMQEYHVAVLPMEVQDLRAAIQRPAKLDDVQLTFEGDLVGDLLFEMRGQVGALPLLEFTLDQLFQRRSGHLLTLQAYREIGGVRGALAKHAESTYTSLPSGEHRTMARVLFLRLIDPGMTEQDITRRRAALTELTLTNPIQTDMLRRTAEAFIAARLLTTSEIAGTITIEVSHEALIREWKRLAGWIVEDRSDILQQIEISDNVAKWMQLGKPKDRLYRGSQLAEAQAWKKRNKERIRPEEKDFLQASKTRERNAQYQRRFFVSAASTLLMVALVVAVVFQRNLLITQGDLLTAKTNLLNSLPVNVTNLNDHGPGSLRDAIAQANPGGAITFVKNLKGTITLTSGELKINKNLAISGPGASQLSISGGNISRVFNISNNVVVTISNLTIKNGHTTYSGNNDISGFGGGIYQGLLSTLVLTNSIIIGNKADIAGGGIYDDLGTLTLTNSTISDNRADGNSIISDKKADGDGGGIYNNGTLFLTNSTISGNTANRDGGGIKSFDALSALSNSTISGNTALINGGGIVNNGGTIAINYCTIYRNTAKVGGGIANETTNEPGILMVASIVAGDQASKDPDISGTLNLVFPSLIQNISESQIGLGIPGYPATSVLANGYIIGKSPNIGPLQNNGGLTQTHALLPGSPAIDLIPINDFQDICGKYGKYATDQRGIARPQGGGCDAGAYEYVLPK